MVQARQVVLRYPVDGAGETSGAEVSSRWCR